MPFQPINFAGIQPIGRPWLRDLIPTLMQGYAASQMPAQMKRQAQQEQLANAMQQLKLQQEPQTFQADIAGKNLSNAFQGMLNQEQPQKFSSEQARQALLNKLTNNQITASDMNIDPAKKAAYIQGLVNAFGGNQATNNQQPNISASPSNLTINPEQANNLASAGIAQPAATNANAGLGNALVRKFLGLPAQTPEEKQAAALELFKQKQGVKATQPTQAFATQNQTSIQAIDNLMPAIDELKNMNIPGQIVGKYWNRTNQAAYKGKLGEIKDTLIKGLGLKPTDTLVSMMDEIAGLQPGEDQSAYRQKLDRLKSELGRRRKTFFTNLNSPISARTSSASTPDITSMSTEDLMKMYKGGG